MIISLQNEIDSNLLAFQAFIARKRPFLKKFGSKEGHFRLLKDFGSNIFKFTLE